MSKESDAREHNLSMGQLWYPKMEEITQVIERLATYFVTIIVYR